MSKDILVIGGGIAGMQSSLDLAEMGFKVHLVEKLSSIGGKMAQLDKTFPTNDCAIWILSPKMLDVGRHPNIELLAYSEVENVEGEAGNFTVTVRKKARYIDENKCTGCGDCAEVCPVVRPSEHDLGMTSRRATHKRYPQAIPGAFAIEKLDKAPCRMACPANLDVQGYVQMVKEGKYREAVEIIMRDLPFPGVLGRVCPHACEKSCRRLEVDEAISIRELKRFAADHTDLNEIPVPNITPREEKVAVIGSGPAGLSAAYFLALEGYKVSVYEAMPEAGGMMRYGIPEHRLSRAVLDAEIENLKRYGIEIHTNTVIGKDLTVEDLQHHGAKAIFIGAGAWKGLKLRIRGEDSEGVADVTSFLRDVHLGKLEKLEGKVVVIGGGHSALDGARVALRLGADEAHIIYRRSRVEMLAEPEEIEEAEKEGVKIHFLVAPTRISSESGKVSGIECIRTRLTEPDTTGRRKPIPIDGSNFFIEADHIIPAIGQEPDLNFLGEKSEIEISKWNLLEVNPETLQTNIPGIFAGGDVITGPATVIEAVDAGKRAAKYMVKYLQGEVLPTEWQEEGPMGTNWLDIPDDEPAKPRLTISTLPKEKRLSGFEEVNLVADEDSAREEAERCINCGGCCECYGCVRACKAEAISFDQKDRILEINVGAIIVATGYDVFDPSQIPEYRYKQLPNVITAIELERLLSASGPTSGHLDRPSDLVIIAEIKALEKKAERLQHVIEKFEDDYGESSADFYKKYQSAGYKDDKDHTEWAEKYGVYTEIIETLDALKKKAEGFSTAKKLAFIQCVGSRDFRFYPFCSGYCCMHSIKEAIIAHEHESETTSTIFGMDIRAVGKGFEEYKIRGGNNSNITYIRGRVAEIRKGQDDNPIVVYEDTRERKVKREAFDLVILATACAPNEGAKQLAEILNIEIDNFGFYRTSVTQPLDTARPGIFVCGCAHGPMDIPESVAQASSAAARAVQTLTASEEIRKAS